MGTKQETDDIARLIHETLELLGRKADPSEVAARVSRLDLGLPLEDEFMIVCSWLGQCELTHKLDQVQVPAKAIATFQVPDLLARFSTGTCSATVLIEVKSSKSNVLSFRPDYLERLRAYSRLLDLPLLIAWKWHSIWCLFNIELCKQQRKNWNISWKDALKENLLGLLAGDFSYSLRAGSGIHFRLRKVQRLSVEDSESGSTENWETVIDQVYFTNGDGTRIDHLDVDVQSVLMIADLEPRDQVEDQYITKRYVVAEELSLFAHGARSATRVEKSTGGTRTLAATP